MPPPTPNPYLPPTHLEPYLPRESPAGPSDVDDRFQSHHFGTPQPIFGPAQWYPESLNTNYPAAASADTGLTANPFTGMIQPDTPFQHEIGYNFFDNSTSVMPFGYTEFSLPTHDMTATWSYVPLELGQQAYPAAIAAPQPMNVINPQPAQEERHVCPQGCNKTFRRPGDYRRHMLKHQAPRFKCIVIDCDKTFYRADKLRSHVKQGHKLTL